MKRITALLLSRSSQGSGDLYNPYIGVIWGLGKKGNSKVEI